MSLWDRVAIVTGASRGIGQAIAVTLARQGARVYAAARNADRIAAWAATEVELGDRVVPISLDVTNREACQKLVDDVMDRSQRLDILVNNAGITRDGLVMSMEDDQFDDVIRTNLTAPFWLIRAASRHMVRARYGRIINIASVSGLMGNAGQANYAAAKAGLIGMTKSVAKELAKRNITCNAVAPGFIETDMTESLPEKLKEGVKQLVPMQRFGAAGEIAEVVAFLAGPGSSYVTGQVITADGGLHT